jgi:photosystem II stability/assembly factor-like uncharacterized protein
MPAVVLFVGTKRGLFVLRSDDGRRSWRISEPRLVGREVYHAFLDPRDGRTGWAATDHAVWGAHVHRSADAGATWTVLEAAPHHEDGRGLKAVWALAPARGSSPDTLFAGIEPAGLFESGDGGQRWHAVAPLNDHPTNDTWQPAGGGLALHSMLVDPFEPDRLYCALSAGGVYRSDDGGRSWSPKNTGVRADFLPQQYPVAGHCVHKLRLHPKRRGRLYQQNHCGTYRSDDCADSWVEITAGLPSEFGYALALDPHDPDTLFVIPEESSHMRTTSAGRLGVYRSRDAGASWELLATGLPQEHVYVTVLREAMDCDALDPCGVYVGTSSGHIFASRDGGESWALLAGYLPRILSVTAGVVGAGYVPGAR